MLKERYNMIELNDNDIKNDSSYMRLVILTSNQLRHKYFANCLIEKFNVVGVFSEEKVFNPQDPKTIQEKTKNKEEEKIWRWHFDLRDQVEENYFGKDKNFGIDSKKIITIPSGKINDEFYVERIKKLKPAIIAVFGTSILKKDIINICPGKIINMHLGLSPYYRGSGTNFWPIYDNKLECVGVTIHLIDEGIDSGNIIHQGRPEIEIEDNQHTIGCKTIIVGTQLMIKAIKECEENKIRCFPQNKKVKGKLCLRKDFTVDDIKRLKKLLEEGLAENYLKNKNKLLKKVKIIP